MKNKLYNALIATALLLLPTVNFAQAPTLGTAANFVLFSTNGEVSNSGLSQLTGNVGSNNGSSIHFGNVNGVMHDADGASAQCAADVLIAYNQLNGAVPTFFPAPLLGNGDTLIAGVYLISAASTLNLNLTLDAKGNSNAVFIFKIQGSFSTGADAKVKLINGAKACNVFWKVEGLVSMASGTSMKGTIIANNAAIEMNTGDTLEGRAISTAGAVTVDGVLAYTPIGCGSPVLNGPSAINLASTACYAVYSASGAVTNSGLSTITGDIGTNVGLTTGFNAINVTGSIHPIPDVSTAQVAADLLNVYSYLNTLPYDIELLYPAQFGHNLVLTPHTYILKAATVFTDTLYLNALGNTNAVFVIQINGALSTSTYAKVLLINGTQAKNVFWKIDGAVDINDYSLFRGTIICNNGAINLNTGVILDGRAFTTTGNVATSAITATITTNCNPTTSPNITSEPSNKTVKEGKSASFSVYAVGTGLTYQWRKGTVNLIDGGTISGATTATLTINPVTAADSASDYNVVITGPAATSTSVNVALTVTDVTSVEIKNSNSVAVYPNPFGSTLTIRMSDVPLNAITELKIYDTMGVEVITVAINNTVTVIETSKLSAGTYFYKIFNNSTVIQSGKLISE
jgi:hypothetical protein